MNLGVFGAALVLSISAIGSAIGIGIAGQASIGAWKKCYLSNKAAPFILTVFAGAPLTQTIYGFLLMNFIRSAVEAVERRSHVFAQPWNRLQPCHCVLCRRTGQGWRRRRGRPVGNRQGLLAVYHRGRPL